MMPYIEQSMEWISPADVALLRKALRAARVWVGETDDAGPAPLLASQRRDIQLAMNRLRAAVREAKGVDAG